MSDQELVKRIRDIARPMAAAIRRVSRRRQLKWISNVEQEVHRALEKHVQTRERNDLPNATIYKVALTTALAVIRNNGVPQQPITEKSEAVVSHAAAIERVSPEKRRDLIDETMASLGAESSQAFRAYLAGFNDSEVADLYGWSEVSARYKMDRGIDRAARLLEQTSDLPVEDSDLKFLRETYRPDASARPLLSCPDDDKIASLILGELLGSERQSVSDHIVECGVCTESFRLLRELHGERRVKKRRRPRVRQRLWAAASALLILGLYGIFGSDYRTPGRNDARGLEEAVEPPHGRWLTRPPQRFEWKGQPGATGYQLRLSRITGDLVWQSETTSDTTVSVPADLTFREGTYFWTVEVSGAAERTRIGPVSFRLRDPNR